MTELSKNNPTGRFAGLADIYSRCRPSYPAGAIDYILEHCRLKAGSILVDVGCGTGISSRLFAERGLQVIGIEPNADMLAKAREAGEAGEPPALPGPSGTPETLVRELEAGKEPAVPGPSGTNNPLLRERVVRSAGTLPANLPNYREGKAEETGLPDHYADAVLSAQAFHWFRPDEALHEFHRILKPGGWCALMWNERDESDPFTAEYGALLRALPDTASVELPRGRAGNALLECDLFIQRHHTTFRNQQTVDEEGLLGRAFSASYAPRDPESTEAFARDLKQLFAKFATDDAVTLRYQTSVYTGQTS